MNKTAKIIFSVLGGFNTVFSLVIPIFVALILINTMGLSPTNQFIILLAGICSTTYRALSLWLK
jgi:hypothetical protein